jgi:hypothetical protein
MALTDEVQNRLSSQLLINITNPQNSTADSIDTTRLSNAVSDVEADFKIECGVAYDNDDETHVTVAVQGVYAKLLIRSAQVDAVSYAFHDKYIERLRALKLIAGRDRIVPDTDSLLTATEDTSGDIPAMDRKNFRGFIPRSPHGGSTTDR